MMTTARALRPRTGAVRTTSLPAALLPAGLLPAVLVFAGTTLSPSPVLAEGPQVVIGEAEAADGYQVRDEPIRVLEGASVPGSIHSRGGDVTVEASAQVGSISTRSGSVEVGPAAVTGSVSTRGGDVSLLRGAEAAGDIGTRDGEIEVQTDALVSGSISTRSGDVRLRPSGRVLGDIGTRDGDITAEAGAVVEGALATRDGEILLGTSVVVASVRTRTGPVTLRGARVRLDVDSSGGDVDIGAGSVIEGDLIVLLPPDCDFPGWFSDPRIPVVRVDGTSQVLGRMIIDERARLEVAGGAGVPEIERYASRDDFGC